MLDLLSNYQVVIAYNKLRIQIEQRWQLKRCKFSNFVSYVMYACLIYVYIYIYVCIYIMFMLGMYAIKYRLVFVR